MNKRLNTIYKDIKENNEEDFKKNKLKIVNMWNQPIWGVTLQIDLSSDVNNQIDIFQKELQEIETSSLDVLPRKCRHISFNQVVFWNGTYKKGKQQTWVGIKNKFINNFENLDNKMKSFDITFSKLVATTGGIIWCATDEEDQLENIREKFFKNLPFPEETTYYNHIIHTTIARFNKKLSDPIKTLNYVNSREIKTNMRIEKIILRNELAFPSTKREDISKIDLLT